MMQAGRLPAHLTALLVAAAAGMTPSASSGALAAIERERSTTAPCDMNGDLAIDCNDVTTFWNDWQNALPTADIDQDGAITGTDVEAFWICMDDPTNGAFRSLNDSCANPIILIGHGPFNFDLASCTSGTQGQGPGCGTTCAANPNMGFDQWFYWKATFTGSLRVTSVGLTQVDTKIAVYSGELAPER